MLTALDKLMWERADQAVLNFHLACRGAISVLGAVKGLQPPQAFVFVEEPLEVPVSGSKSVDRHGGWHHVSQTAGVIVGEGGSQTEIFQNQEQPKPSLGTRTRGWPQSSTLPAHQSAASAHGST